MLPHYSQAKMLIHLCIVLAVLVINIYQPVNSSKYKYDHWKMKSGEKVSLISKGYPAKAPSNLKQVWTVKPPVNGYLTVTCHELIIPWESPCEDYNFNYVDFEKGGLIRKVCGGDLSGFKFVTTPDGLIATLLTSPGDSVASVNCTVEAIGGPKTHHWSFLNMEIEEIDSSEHGGPRGRKKPTCPCGWANKNQARIINGGITKPNEYPFVGFVKYRYVKGGGFCGASLITEYHVLTAAHCINAKGPKMNVVFGEHDLRRTSDTNATIEVEVRSWVTHPGFRKYEHDIAILILKRPIPISKQIGPVCLPAGPIGNMKGEYVKVLGWGYDDKFPDGTPVLQKADVRVLSKRTCYKVWSPWVTKGGKNTWCVFSPKQRSCFGDSGGPVVWVDPETNRYTQIGINAFVKEGCAADWPVVLTDVSIYVNWIRYIVKETMPEVKICTKPLDEN